MKRITKVSWVIAAGMALAFQGAYAGPNDNNLILDINNNSGAPAGSTEFTVNLGQLSSFTPGENLSSLLSGFSSYNSATAPGLNVGVAGGRNGQGGLAGTGNDVFFTTLRTAGGDYTSGAGSAAPTAGNPSKGQIANAGGVAGGFAGFGNNFSTSDPGSWTSLIAKDPNTIGTAANSFGSYLGAQPLATMTGSSIVLDLWQDTVTSSTTTSGWLFEGTLTLNLGGASPTLTFDQATPVPEPTTYGLLAGAGLLLVSLRRQIQKSA